MNIIKQLFVFIFAFCLSVTIADIFVNNDKTPKAISQIQRILKTWQGDPESLQVAIKLAETNDDPWGNKYIVELEQINMFDEFVMHLKIRSKGPDGLRYNKDDIMFGKRKYHPLKEKN